MKVDPFVNISDPVLEDELGSSASAEKQNNQQSQNPLFSTWPVMGNEAYLGLAGDIVRAVDPFTEADPVSVLLHTITAFGNVIGCGPHAQVQNDLHPPRIFFVAIGETSKGRKGVSWGTPREILRQCDSRWASDRVRTGLRTGEGLIYHVRDESQNDEGIADKRLLAVEPEFSIMLRIMAREGNSLSGVLREAWDSGNLSTLTKNDPLKATSVHFSLIGHTTETELIRNLNETERANGFGNRILWACVRRSKSLPDGECMPESQMDKLAQRMRFSIEQAGKIGRVTRDSEATQLWRRVYDELSEPRPGLSGALLNRAEAQVLRLSLIYALLDASPLIRPDHLQAALAIWDYCESSVLHVFGDRTGNPVADRIMDVLRESEDGLTEDEVGRIFAGHKTKEKDKAIEELLRLRRITKESRQTNGRPRTVLRVAR